MNTRTILTVGAVAVASSLTTVATLAIVRPAPVYAMPAQGTSGLTLYAYHRDGNDQKDQGFIFFDQKSGDIWVYDNENVKEHYRVKAMGQALEVVK
jgi:hypothetical protein